MRLLYKGIFPTLSRVCWTRILEDSGVLLCLPWFALFLHSSSRPHALVVTALLLVSTTMNVYGILAVYYDSSYDDLTYYSVPNYRTRSCQRQDHYTLLITWSIGSERLKMLLFGLWVSVLILTFSFPKSYTITPVYLMSLYTYSSQFISFVFALRWLDVLFGIVIYN